MTAPSLISSGVGTRNLRVFPLNGSGYIAAINTTAYEGILASGVKGLELTDPQPRFITHMGDDAPFALDILPPTEAMTGQATFGKQNNTLDAALTGIPNFVVGEGNGQAFGTNLRGFETEVGCLVYRQSEDTDPASSLFGSRTWESKIFPRVVFFPLEPGYNDNPEERSYALRPGFVTRHLWGTALATGTEGVTRAQGFRFITQYKPKIVAYVGDNVASEYLFPAAFQAAATGKIAVWLNGVPRTTNMTLATTGVTFTSLVPGTGVNVTIFYETPGAQ